MKTKADKYGRKVPQVKEIEYDVSNGVMAHTDSGFKKACENAGIPATSRQASKFRRKFGKAFASRNLVKETV